MNNIKEVASKLNLVESDLELYGNYMAKVINKPVNKNSKLILVTAMTPTKHGEGKTTVCIGLNDGLCKLGNKSVAVLREPSMGPVFGMKGGACGGGMARIVPEDDINLHFTGDFHAITSANNLLAAAIDNSIYWDNKLNIDPEKVVFKRCLDVNDRSLRDKFDITAASEVMAIFCLANSLDDLKERLGNITVAYTYDNKPVYAKDLEVDGAMFKLLEQAYKPNLVQTLEGNPVFVHGGPFANIAHGCSSITSLKLGLGLADYVVTEAGFGSDLGLEKFMNITSRSLERHPDYVVLTVTVRAINELGIDNLLAHIDNIKQYHLPFCVTINHFIEDNKEDIDNIINYCDSLGVKCIVNDAYNKGSDGCIDLASYIVNIGINQESNFNYLYDINLSAKDKFEIIAKNTYHANNIEYSSEALEKLNNISYNYPICVAKTQYSISDDKDVGGYPKDYTIHVRDIKVQTGSKMIIFYLNKIITMPGLPESPNFINIK